VSFFIYLFIFYFSLSNNIQVTGCCANPNPAFTGFICKQIFQQQTGWKSRLCSWSDAQVSASSNKPKSGAIRGTCKTTRKGGFRISTAKIHQKNQYAQFTIIIINSQHKFIRTCNKSHEFTTYQNSHTNNSKPYSQSVSLNPNPHKTHAITKATTEPQQSKSQTPPFRRQRKDQPSIGPEDKGGEEDRNRNNPISLNWFQNNKVVQSFLFGLC